MFAQKLICAPRLARPKIALAQVKIYNDIKIKLIRASTVYISSTTTTLYHIHLSVFKKTRAPWGLGRQERVVFEETGRQCFGGL
jgi:hypothetical protein